MSTQFAPGFQRFIQTANRIHQGALVADDFLGKSQAEIQQVLTQKFQMLSQAMLANRNNQQEIRALLDNLDQLAQLDETRVLSEQLAYIRSLQNEDQRKQQIGAILTNQRFTAACAERLYKLMKAMEQSEQNNSMMKAAENAMNTLSEDKDQRYRQAGYSYESLPGKMLMDIIRFMIDIFSIWAGKGPIFSSTNPAENHDSPGKKEIVKYLKA